MKRLISYALWSLITIGLSTPVFAQQTYFNVPSSDITKEGKVLVQQQIDFSSELLRSTTTFDYGLPTDWEIGVNLYNLNYEPAERRFMRNDSTLEMPFAPLVLLNAQKALSLSDKFKVSAGGQSGFNPSPERRTRLVYYTYANLEYTIGDQLYEVTAGVYHGNARFLSQRTQTGFQTGFDASIIHKKLHVLGDWISGKHELAQLTLGLEVYVTEHIPLSLGWQRSNIDGSSAISFQLTYTPN